MNPKVVSKFVDKSVVVEVRDNKGDSFVVRGDMLWDNPDDSTNTDVTIVKDTEAITLDANSIINIRLEDDQKQPSSVKPKKTALIAPIIQRFLEEGCRDEEDCTNIVLKHCEEEGITHNSKGNKVNRKRVDFLVNAILRDIRKGIGPKKWRSYEVDQTEDKLAIKKINKEEPIRPEDKLAKYLRKIAREKRYVFYDEAMKHISLNPKDYYNDLLGAMRDIMELIDRDDIAEGRPFITALIVSKETKMPGNGFFEMAKESGRKFSDRQLFWASEVKKVFEYYEDKEPIEEEK